MYRANVYKIFLASPSDVSNERQIARDVIQKWNELHSEKHGIVLQAIGWETHSYSAMEGRAQGIINKQILEDCDFLIGIFWCRIGTPTGDFESGTLEEIQEHIDAGKPAMICFSDQPVAMGSVDQTQYSKLMEFKKECFEKGLVSPYETLDQFRNILNEALIHRANKQDPFNGVNADIPFEEYVEKEDDLPNLTEEAKELLINASEDQNGRILKLSTTSGIVIQTNGKDFIKDNSARERAKWTSAVHLLENEELIEDASYKGEIFRVTHYGFEVVDKIKEA